MLLSVQLPAIEIVYKGQPPRDKRHLEKHLAVVQQNSGASECIADSAVSWLRENGFLDASARLDKGQLIVITSEQYMLDRFRVTADSIFEMPVGVPFTRSGFEQAMEQLLGLYRERGCYFVNGTITGAVKGHGRVTVELTLNEGPPVTLANNLYTGLVRTKSGIIDEYLPCVPGDTLTDLAISLSEEAAGRIEFVNFEPPVQIRPRGGYTEADLEYRFREKKQFYFFGGGGYVPDSPTGLVWNVNMRLLNLFGGGKEVAVRSERREKGRNMLDVRYCQPVFFLGIGQAELGVATRDYRDQFYEFALRLEYSTLVSRVLTTGLAFDWKHVEPSTDMAGYSRFGVAFSLGRRNLDDKWNPSRGLALDWTITYAHRRYSADRVASRPEQKVYNETRNEVAVELYWPLIGFAVGHLGLSYIGLETSESLPPVSELTFIGGPGTLRGFRNDQYIAQRTALVTIEPRLRFRQGYIFAFYDGAYINRPIPAESGDIETDELYRYGYGLGIALADRERLLKLSVGWNEDAAFDQPCLSVQFSSDL